MSVRDILLGGGVDNGLLAATNLGQYTTVADVAASGDDAFYVTGFHASGNVNNNGGAYVTKLDRQLSVLWQRQFPMLQYENRVSPVAIATGPDGSVVMAGLIQTPTGYVGYLCKLSPAGVLLSQRRLSYGSFDSICVAVTVDALGNIFTGFHYSGGENSKIFLVMLDQDLTLQWAKELSRTIYTTIGGHRYQAGLSLGVTADWVTGGLYLHGKADDIDGSGSIAVLMRLDGAGTIQWQRYVVAANAGGLAIDDATLWLAGSLDNGVRLINFDQSGNVLLAREIVPEPYAGVSGVAVHTDGSPYVVGGQGMIALAASGDPQAARSLTFAGGSLALSGICLGGPTNLYSGGTITLADGIHREAVLMQQGFTPGLGAGGGFALANAEAAVVAFTPSTGTSAFSLVTGSVAASTVNLSVSASSFPFVVIPIS